jgi:hypothetical protein
MKQIFRKLLWLIGKIFSNDPIASCGRILAFSSMVYVGIMGVIHFQTLTVPQVEFLRNFLAGIFGFVAEKFFSGVKTVIGGGQ